jgi:hypothetical protein
MVGKSRAIATGLLANSNQLGAAGGASMGGSEPLLALGSFPSVALFCLGTVAAEGWGIGLLMPSFGKVYVQVAGA